MVKDKIYWKHLKNMKALRFINPIMAIILFTGTLLFSVYGTVQAADLLIADFNSDAEGFNYSDDTFLGTSQPSYASGSRITGSNCYGGSGGCLNIELGGVNSTTINNMSGGWEYAFSLASTQPGVSLSIRYRLVMPSLYDYDEFTRVLVSLDGTLYGRGSKDYVDHTGGDNTFSHDTGWVQATLYLGDLDAGSHTLILGAYSNKKNSSSEISDIYFDDVALTSDNPTPATSVSQLLIDRLDINTFKSNIQTLSNFGDRCHQVPNCAPYTSFYNAQNWVEAQLQSWGYTTYKHAYTDGSYSGSNLYATKVGSVHPDQMYIVAGHLDGRGGGGAADDNGSTVALLLELARVLSSPDVQTDVSVRFIFWDQEEWGLYGSGNYVDDRRTLQGLEDPPGSGLYPEPTWLGNITHDMILYDHGVGSVTTAQSPYADLDVEWRRGSTYEAQSKELAQTWRYLSGEYAPDYPANSADYSTNTDDTPFHNYCPSISVRENRRSLSSEWINPYYHNTGDVYASYIEDDFVLGFNAVQTTLGVVSDLAGTVINAQPIADAQSVTTAEDTPVGITLTGSDPESEPITFAVAEDPDHGSLTGTAPNLTYTTDPDYNGSDSFTFVVNDGVVDSDPGVVSITVTPGNDPPSANSQSVTTDEDVPILINLTGTDPDSDPLSFSVSSSPSHGVLSGDAPNLTYTPDLNYNGSDSFSFTVNDGLVTSDPAVVSITISPVNDLPIADSQSVSTPQDTPVGITLTGSDPEGASLSFAVTGSPSHGSLIGTPPSLTYTPDSGFNGIDSFQFVANDGSSDSSPATFSIAVGVSYSLPFEDDFETDLGWVVDPYGTDTSNSGTWMRANPQGTDQNGPKQLDVTTSETHNLVTGPLAGKNASQYDLDGVSSVLSPLINLPAGQEITLSFQYYFAHGSNASASDYLKVKIVGSSTSTVLDVRGANSDVDAVWTPYSVNLDAFAGQTIRILIEAGDLRRNSLVEAAIDDLSIAPTSGGSDILVADFDTNTEGFSYIDDPFRSTNQPTYSDGNFIADSGFNGGGLRVLLGGLDRFIIQGISGGWQTAFNLPSQSDISVSFWYKLTQSPDYDLGEFSQVLLSLDGVLYGSGSNDFVAQVDGNGNGGIPESTGWQLFSVTLENVPAGAHVLVIGAYNNQKSYANETTEIILDQVLVTSY